LNNSTETHLCSFAEWSDAFVGDAERWKMKNRVPDPHFARQLDLCPLCQLRQAFVLKVEDMNEEIEAILNDQERFSIDLNKN